MIRAWLAFLALSTLVTSACGVKLFTNKIDVECTSENLRGGRFVDQSSLPSKPLKKKPSGQITSTHKNTYVRTASGFAIPTRVVVPTAESTDDSCPTTDKDVETIAQDTSVWCWAASAEAVMKYHSQLPNKSQCNIVNTIFRRDGDQSGPDRNAFCCGNKEHADCHNNGLPSWAFIEYGFDWLMVRGPLEREKLAAQLCSNGPFIFILSYANGGGHSFVVGDYDYDPETEEMLLWVHDHSWTLENNSLNKKIPTPYQVWTYEDYAMGRWEGKIHNHELNYVYVTAPAER